MQAGGRVAGGARSLPPVEDRGRPLAFESPCRVAWRVSTGRDGGGPASPSREADLPRRRSNRDGGRPRLSLARRGSPPRPAAGEVAGSPPTTAGPSRRWWLSEGSGK
ncbi:hypothetical protein NL676_025863 [Syzygium grande]|nr:hypothetical protein NL676_025863 [Syzygium grande]